MNCCSPLRRRGAPLLTPEDVRLLTQVGFLAAGAGDVPRAERILGALARVRAQRAFPHVGRALAWMNAAQPHEAVRLLEQAPPGAAHGEDADTLAAFLALALQLDGRSSESRRALQKLLRNAPQGTDNEGLRLARRMLGEAPGASAAPP